MIPFRDNIPSRSFPIITVLLIAANIVAFLYEVALGRYLEPFLRQYGVVPAAVLAWPQSDVPVSVVAVPFITSMFLHGGWLHLIGNMWYLWIFGDNVEDRMGHIRYLIFYLVCGVLASLAHVVTTAMFAAEPGSLLIPSLGASGAISGVLGGYILLYPRRRVTVILFRFLTEVPAYVAIGIWFVFQLISGLGMLGGGSQQGGVAYAAHVGGFVAGIVLVKVFTIGRAPALAAR